MEAFGFKASVSLEGCQSCQAAESHRVDLCFAGSSMGSVSFIVSTRSRQLLVVYSTAETFEDSASCQAPCVHLRSQSSTPQHGPARVWKSWRSSESQALSSEERLSRSMDGGLWRGRGVCSTFQVVSVPCPCATVCNKNSSLASSHL